MAEILQFSPRPNRAREIPWRPWGAEAFDDAARGDRPVLLCVGAFWCPVSHLMDETTYSEPDVIEMISTELIPIRVDADRLPHVHERYAAGGWPTNAFLTPTGEVLWAGTRVPPVRFREVAHGVLTAWRGRRSELDGEIERRRRAMEAARSNQRTGWLVRRDTAEDVLVSARESFDPEHGGFGDPPRPPYPEAIELLFTESERPGRNDVAELAARTLDGVLHGELHDREHGGFFHYARGPGWSDPAREKLLDAQAGLLSAFGLGAHLAGRDDWRAAAESIVAWVDGTLARPDGLWSASQSSPEIGAGGLAMETAAASPPVDPRLFTDANAVWIRALADAGCRLGRQDWTDAAARALATLLEGMAGPDDLLYHVREPGADPAVPGLLSDAVATARACVAVHQATGACDALDHARRLAGAMRRTLWAETGGFLDFTPDGPAPGALRYPSRPFHLNAGAARLFVDLALSTGEGGYRAVAERLLADLSPQSGRYGVAASEFALAVGDFFEAPVRVVVVGPGEAGAELRSAALSTPRAGRRVWHLPAGGRIGDFEFRPEPAPAAYVCRARSSSKPILDAADLRAALAVAR